MSVSEVTAVRLEVIVQASASLSLLSRVLLLLLLVFTRLGPLLLGQQTVQRLCVHVPLQWKWTACVG